MTLLLATTNTDKLREMRAALAGAPVHLMSLADLPPISAPEETGATFWENARRKALAYAVASGLATVAEDSGLAIEPLNGEPGVRSARYLGPDATYAERFADIYQRLSTLPRKPHRARFVTALALARGDTILFETETRIEGVVAPKPAGDQGFGYDPIFLYVPSGTTTAEMSAGDKAAVSHRARACRDLRRALLTRALG